MSDEIIGIPKENFEREHAPADLRQGSRPLKNDPLLEGLFTKAFDCLSCHAVMVDQNGVIIAVNQAWRDFFSKISLEEQRLPEWMNYLEVCEWPKAEFLTGGKSFGVGLRAVLDRHTDRFEMEYSTSSEGSVHWNLGRANGLEINGLRYAFILHQNISAYKDKATQSLSQHTQLPTLVDTVKSLVSTLDLQGLLNTILKKLSNLIRYNAAAVFTFESGNIIRQAYQGPPLSELTPVFLTPKGRYPEIKQLIAGTRSFFIQDIRYSPGLLGEMSELLKLENSILARFHAWLFLPLLVNKNKIGLMVLAYHKTAYYDQAALRIGELFANFAAIALQNAHLYELSQNTAMLKERNRLAYELHDSIAQSLYSINLYANAAQKALETEKPSVANDHLQALQRLSGEAVSDMRLMIFELNNQMLEEFGLAKAFEARFEAIETKKGIKTGLTLVGKLSLPNRIEREIFGIIQDLLILIQKTTPLQALSIKITASKHSILIKINTDQRVDPHGNFEDADIARLNRIRNRVRKTGGSLHFSSSGKQEPEIRYRLDF